MLRNQPDFLLTESECIAMDAYGDIEDILDVSDWLEEEDEIATPEATEESPFLTFHLS